MISITVKDFLERSLGTSSQLFDIGKFHYGGDENFQKLRERLWQFQAPDGVFKLDPDPEDFNPDDMDKIMSDEEATAIVMALIRNADQGIMQTAEPKEINPKKSVDEAVKLILTGQFISDKRIAEKLLEKTERYLRPFL
ncbi:MAG: hypothetical protein AAB432_01800 [Patescibacteria group bacterium]